MKILDAKIKNLSEELESLDCDLTKITSQKDWVLDEKKQQKRAQIVDKKCAIEKQLNFLQDKEKLEGKFKKAKISKRVWWNESDFVSPVKSQVEACISGNSGCNVYLFGTPGVGKTWSVSEVLRDLVYEGKNVKIYHIYDLEMEVKKSWSDRYRDEDPLVCAKTCDVLVLDDLGLEKATDAMLKILFEIANEREDLMLPTIYISNFDKKRLWHRFNELTNAGEIVNAIMSRIFGNCEVIEFQGNDRRIRGSKN